MRKLRINFQKRVPYPFDVVLSQYYDYEHIEHVHPTSLGRYEMYEENDDYVAYEQIWPKSLFGKPTSIVEQRFEAPNKTFFDFVEGRHKGTKVESVLLESPDGTIVDETYEMNLPDWGWLRTLLKPFVVKRVDQIWAEDTGVEVCHDGWPGIPEAARKSVAQKTERTGGPNPETTQAIPEFPDGEARICIAGAREIAVFNVDGEYFAIDNRCPHTGGPLAIGSLNDATVKCPWHGTQFDLRTGSVKCGASTKPATTYPVQKTGGEIIIEINSE